LFKVEDMRAPVVLFVYNRLDHTRRTIEALARNTLAAESDVIIFSDGSKQREHDVRVEEVRAYVRTIRGFKSVSVVESEINKGLSRSIISGVTQVVQERGSVIVLEDDLVTSPYFLSYMNQGLSLYADDERVVSIHGYVYPVRGTLPESFFIRGADCWGWATWRRGWDVFEHDGQKLLDELEEHNLLDAFDYESSYPYSEMLRAQIKGQNDSWAIRWYASAFLKNQLTLYPGTSLVRNIGNDNSGTHSGATTIYDAGLSFTDIKLKKETIEEDVRARKLFSEYFRSLEAGFFRRFLRKLYRSLLR
jgi:hypothetical protein